MSASSRWATGRRRSRTTGRWPPCCCSRRPVAMTSAPGGSLWGMDAREPAVRAEALVKHYGGRTGVVEAVRGVDLRVAAGEVFGFLGPNGAGKSTTVKMLTTLLSITAGSAHVAGLDVAREPDDVRRKIGVALQEAGLDPRQTGRELLVLQGRLFDLSTREAATRAEELLELGELPAGADRAIQGYSGGMK